MPSSLSEIEQRILDFMVQYLRNNTYQPSIREIGEEFGIKSTKTVSEHLQALAEKGFLERDPSRSRGVRILGVDLHADTVSLPCYRDLPDGNGSDGAEMFLTMDRRLASSKAGFFLRARGDQLAVLGVQDGDWILVEPARVDEIRDGAIVAARVDGDVACFQRFSRNGGGVRLEPLRADATPVLVDDPSRLELVGQVAGLYRRMDPAAAPVSLTAH